MNSDVHPFRPATWPRALWLCLALALIARLPGFTYGLPSLFYHHDEPQIVLRALRFGTGDFNPHAFRWPGTWLIDLMFLLYALVFVVGRVAGQWHGAADFGALYFRDPTLFYVVGRLASLALGLLTVPLVFAVAERIAGRRAATAAALLLALNWLHADLARVTVPSVPMVFWVSVALWLMSAPGPARAARSIGIGIAAGFAAACLYYGGWVLLAWPGVLAARAERGWPNRLRAALGIPFLLAVLGAASGFLASCPWALLDSRTFLHDLGFVNSQYATWHGAVPRALLPLYNVWDVFSGVMPGLLGWPVWLLAIAGAVALVRSGDRWSRGVMAFVGGFAALLLISRYLMPRYAMPWLPLTSVFAGAALSRLWDQGRWGRAAAALALGWCLFDTGEVSLDRMSRDTRALAKSWVESHVPIGSRMVVDALHHRNTFTAPLDLGPASVRDKLERLAAEPSPYGSSEAYRLYYEFLQEHPGPRPYEQEWTEAGTRVLTIEQYGRNGYRYAMVSSLIYEGFHHHGEWEDNPAGRFYGGLERRGRLLAEFQGGRFLHPGPTIRIYELPDSSTSSNRGSPSPSHR